MFEKILVICGPTATGKTGLGIKLAQKFEGEIISADSRQVYQGMDIITGKDLPPNSQFQIQNFKLKIKNQRFKIGYYDFEGVPVWLLDIVKPNQRFTVAEYYVFAWKVIKDIWERKKLPILVGGTGFYIKAVLENIGTLGIKPNWKLRQQLANYSVEELQDYLKKINLAKWEKMNESDRKNPRRLVRAIEIAQNPKFLPSNSNQIRIVDSQKWETLMVGLTAPLPILYKRIDERVEERIKKGAEAEVKRLLSEGYNWENSVLGTTIGYREWRDFFEGRVLRQAVIQRWKFAEHNYARRQLTWFKKVSQIHWFDITQENREIEKLVKDLVY